MSRTPVLHHLRRIPTELSAYPESGHKTGFWEIGIEPIDYPEANPVFDPM
jgi:hypothetical protein